VPCAQSSDEPSRRALCTLLNSEEILLCYLWVSVLRIVVETTCCCSAKSSMCCSSTSLLAPSPRPKAALPARASIPGYLAPVETSGKLSRLESRASPLGVPPPRNCCFFIYFGVGGRPLVGPTCVPGHYRKLVDARVSPDLVWAACSAAVFLPKQGTSRLIAATRTLSKACPLRCRHVCAM
jgi:hypothetical protein